MNNYVRKFLNGTAILLTIFVPIFGLSEDEINIATAHLGPRGYGIRKKLIEESQNKNIQNTNLIKMYRQNKRDKSLFRSTANLDDTRKLAEKILKTNSYTSNVKQIKQKSLLPLLMVTNMAMLASKAPSSMPDVQSNFQSRFDGSAAFGFLSNALPPFITFVTISWILYKIEYFVNGPALAAVIAEKAERKRADERLEKEINKKFDDLREELHQLQSMVQNSHKNMQKSLVKSENQLDEALKTVQKTKTTNQALQTVLTERVLPAVKNIGEQVSGLKEAITPTPENHFPFSCCSINPGDVTTPQPRKKSENHSDDEKED